MGSLTPWQISPLKEKSKDPLKYTIFVCVVYVVVWLKWFFTWTHWRCPLWRGPSLQTWTISASDPFLTRNIVKFSKLISVDRESNQTERRQNKQFKNCNHGDNLSFSPSQYKHELKVINYVNNQNVVINMSNFYQVNVNTVLIKLK